LIPEDNDLETFINYFSCNGISITDKDDDSIFYPTNQDLKKPVNKIVNENSVINVTLSSSKEELSEDICLSFSFKNDEGLIFNNLKTKKFIIPSKKEMIKKKEQKEENNEESNKEDNEEVKPPKTPTKKPTNTKQPKTPTKKTTNTTPTKSHSKKGVREEVKPKMENPDEVCVFMNGEEIGGLNDVDISNNLTSLLELIKEELLLEDDTVDENLSFQKDGEMIDFASPISDALHLDDGKYFVTLLLPKMSTIYLVDEDDKEIGEVEVSTEDTLLELRKVMNDSLDNDMIPKDFKFLSKTSVVANKQESKKIVSDALKEGGKIVLRVVNKKQT